MSNLESLTGQTSGLPVFELLQQLEFFLDVMQLEANPGNKALKQKALSFIDAATRPEAEFSSMATDFCAPYNAQISLQERSR